MQSKYSDENSLLVALKAGKAGAFAYFYKEYKFWMFLEAYDYLNDESAAQDLIQELLIDFWQYNLYQNVVLNLKGYLIIMIRNRSYNYLRTLGRQQKKMQEHVTVQELVMPDIDMERGELSRRIDEAILKLPPRTRSAFVYCYIERLSHQRAADIMGVSRNTLRSQLKAALKMLRNDLKKLVYG